MLNPSYWATACSYLAERDPIMANLIERFPSQRLCSRGNAFVTLARSIVGQQISVRAAQAVWDRFAALFSDSAELPHPAVLLLQPEGSLRQVGLSLRKVGYLYELARFFLQQPDVELEWREMDDEQLIAALTKLRGIGRWTAEMFLIFYLLRANVLPLDDMGLLSGVGQLYFQQKRAGRAEVLELAEKWQPYRSVATWYIWRSLDPLPVAY